MEQISNDVALNGDKEVKLGQMRDYLLEWYYNGIAEHITKLDEVYFEDYDKELVMKDAKTEEAIFHAVFHRHQKVDDSSIVYLSGIVNEELRGIIGKIIQLDEQAEMYSKQQAATATQDAPAQKGE